MDDREKQRQMRIVVCVKHVPDVQSERGFSGGRVDRSQGDGTLNELDENAVEAALALVATRGGDVTVLTVGPDAADDAVRRGLQMGAHRADHPAPCHRRGRVRHHRDGCGTGARRRQAWCMTPSDAKADLHEYLCSAREALLWKVEGLSEYEVRRPRTPTGTDLLGLMKHVASVDVGYFGEGFGRPFATPLPWFDGIAGLSRGNENLPGVTRQWWAGYREQVEQAALEADGATGTGD